MPFHGKKKAGAFIGAFLLARFSSRKFYKINIVIAVLAITALLFIQEKMVIFVLLGIIGFTIANIFPIIFGMAIQSRPDKANEISGLMITGVFGGTIPVFMGLLTDKMGSQVGSVIVILISALYLLINAFVVNVESK